MMKPLDFKAVRAKPHIYFKGGYYRVWDARIAFRGWTGMQQVEAFEAANMWARNKNEEIEFGMVMPQINPESMR